MYAIYARQSIDKPDSISIESQIEFCEYEARGGNCRIYRDKGFSGKNTDRPEFQKLIADIQKGEIEKVIVYKLDRISRSILDFSIMMELFQKHNVEFISATEKFDTGSIMGRAMLNICIVFAQMERETIQKRVTDAYYSRSQKGFYMGGKPAYGYVLKNTVIQGIKTSMYEVNPEEAQHIKAIFDIYQEPSASYGDIQRYFDKCGMLKRGIHWNRVTIASYIKNPAYVMADGAIFDFFKSQGVQIVNDRADFAGLNGCYYFRNKEVCSNKLSQLEGNMIVLAPHAGIIPADVWLRCRKKCLNNPKYQPGRKAIHSWLAGKLKCALCGYAVVRKNYQQGLYSYYLCSYKHDSKGCEGIGRIRADLLEEAVFDKMAKKLREFGTLDSGAQITANSKLDSLREQLLQIETQIQQLIDTIDLSNPTLITYLNQRILELDKEKSLILKGISEASVNSVDNRKLLYIEDCIEKWDEVSFDDKRWVCDLLIDVIRVAHDNIDIHWRF